MGAKVFPNVLRIDQWGPTLVKAPKNGTPVHHFTIGYETACLNKDQPRLGSYSKDVVTCPACLGGTRDKNEPTLIHYIHSRDLPTCYLNSYTRISTNSYTNVTCPECRKYLLKEVMLPAIKNRGKK